MTEIKIINVTEWLEENKIPLSTPPVCNKLMHFGQLIIMFVGGGNIREDFHINEGEELFYQLKGEMLLVVEEAGRQKEIPIKAGEMFLLPGRVPHSPRRYPGSMGLVIERERHQDERDALRYYCSDKE